MLFFVVFHYTFFPSIIERKAQSTVNHFEFQVMCEKRKLYTSHNVKKNVSCVYSDYEGTYIFLW